MDLLRQNINLLLKITIISLLLLLFWNQKSKNKIEDITGDKMVLIPNGEYNMGRDHSESYLYEKQIHSVKIDSFYMDKYEVSNADFLLFIKETGYITTAEQVINWDDMKNQLSSGAERPPDSLIVPGSLVFQFLEYNNIEKNQLNWWKWKPGVSWRNPSGVNSSIKKIMSHPAVHVSWDDAAAYAKWAKKRLPTEAEWEWAARGGKKNMMYPWGNESINSKPMKANFWQGHFPFINSKEDGFIDTSPVGSFPPNQYGLYDMSGNVWEWCYDDYNNNTYHIDGSKELLANQRVEIISDNIIPPLALKKIMRGGSFLCNDSYCSGYRVARRMSASKDTGLSHTGFRCAKDI